MKASQQKKIQMIKKTFTLIEMSMVLLIIVLLASLVVSQGVFMVEQSTSLTIMNRVQKIEDAIKGNPSIKDYDGSYIPNGYINDMGAFPTSLDDLMLKPALLPTYSFNPIVLNSETLGYLSGGWQGPYIRQNDFSKINSLITFDNSTDVDADIKNDLTVDINWTANSDELQVNDLQINSTQFFKERSIAVINFPSSYLNSNKVLRIHYWSIEDGLLKTHTPIEINSPTVNLSGILTEKVWSGPCAFYAEFDVNIASMITVTTVAASPPAIITNKEIILVAATGATGAFANKENQIATRNGSSNNFTFEAPDGKVVFVSDSGKTLIYDGSAWQELKTKTSSLYKTIKTDVTLELK